MVVWLRSASRAGTSACPEEIGRELAKRATAGDVKSDAERMQLEALSEERYLKREGHTQEEVEVRVLNLLQRDRDTQGTCGLGLLRQPAWGLSRACTDSSALHV